MENTNRDAANNAAPENDWQNAERNEARNENSVDSRNDFGRSAQANGYGTEERQKLHASDSDKEEEAEENEDEAAGDWGHTDPAETNSPFPDSNDPSGPGSAV